MTAGLIQIIREIFEHLGCKIEDEETALMTGIDIMAIKCDEKYIAKAYSGKGNLYVDAINQLAQRTDCNQKVLVVSKIISDMKGRTKDVIVVEGSRLGLLKFRSIMPTKTLNYSTYDFAEKIMTELLSFFKDVKNDSSIVKCILKSPNNEGIVEIERQGQFLYGKPDITNKSDWTEFCKHVSLENMEKFNVEWIKEKRHVEIYSRDYDPSRDLPPRIRLLCDFVFGQKPQNITATYYEIPNIRLIV